MTNFRSLTEQLNLTNRQKKDNSVFAFQIDRRNANFFADTVNTYFPELTIVGQEMDENVNSPRSYKYIPNGAYVLLSPNTDYDVTWYQEYFQLLEEEWIEHENIVRWEEDPESVMTRLENYIRINYPQYYHKRLGKNWRTTFINQAQNRTPKTNWINIGMGIEIMITANNVHMFDNKTKLTRILPKNSAGIKKLDKESQKLASQVWSYLRREGWINQ